MTGRSFANAADFGINIACYRADYPFAKACVASIRRHLGDVPVCLFVDGDFSVRELERTYGIRAIYARDVADPELRRRSYGYGLTKMIVFWESPFERFLYLDADTVIWGDVLDGLDVARADFIFNAPHEAYTEHILKDQYFDYDRLFEHTRWFPWQGLPYFNTGAFIARRGLFSTADYYELLDLKLQDDSLMPTGEQGILNVMVFRAAAEARITVAQAALQTVVPVVAAAELQQRFPIPGDPLAFRSPPENRSIIHWAGAKPFSLRSDVFREPMTYYRRLGLHDRRPSLAFLDLAILALEDLRADFRRALPPQVRHTIHQLRRWRTLPTAGS
jgi:hypothetical protein